MAETAETVTARQARITSDNPAGDPSHAHLKWHVRHDDEIWADGLDDENDPVGVHIANCSSALDAQAIVTLHNAHLEED